MQIIIFIRCIASAISDYSCEVERLKDELKKQYENSKTTLENQIKRKEEILAHQENQLHLLLKTTSPFSMVAKMKNDADLIIFNDSINYMKYKRHPAYKAAEEIKRLRKIFSEVNKKAVEIEYKYQYILSLIPELEEYIDNDESLLSISDSIKDSNIDDLRDKRTDYLSKEEYARLSEDERSQLALDRYIKTSKKTRWEVGRDYEMSCAFQLTKQGYRVNMFGIKNRFNDLGRDLIATKSIHGLKVMIIQCKNWSANHVIHENVIMQLYGTTTMYKISSSVTKVAEIFPVLMVPSYTKLSDTAEKFAKALNVRIVRMENLDFPRIKCNINNGNKIYHLPFDQQYDRTEIKLKGEFLAYTVKEASEKGFRRAHRYNMANIS
ncbi:MAG: hypothetical protein HDS08_00705 [Bacteroides sp.]|nr:hypothetical protein [Bacteroides sp.]